MVGIILYLLLSKISGAKTTEIVDFLQSIPGRPQKSEKHPKSADFGVVEGGMERVCAGMGLIWPVEAIPDPSQLI